MSLAVRVLLTVALTALFSASLTGYLSYRAASERVPRAFGVAQAPRGGGSVGAGPFAEPGGAMGASRALLSELQGATFSAAAIALVVAMVVGGWIALRASRPISRLAEVTRRYGAGERWLRAEPKGPTEVLALARVFNDTADRLQAEEDQRQRFTADAAHELRTPLSVLKSELEALQDGLMQPDDETLQQLLQQVDLLGRLVADLRLVTLAETGELTLHRQRLDLGALVRDTVAAFQARAARVGVELRIDVERVWVDVDAERLRQVLNALVDNALLHAEQSTAVDVVVRCDGERAVLEVLDDGPGIAAQEVPHVFRRFYRVDASRRSGAGGSGLGLSIVAAIVALHGGTVSVLQRTEGGARLRVELPSAVDA